MVNIYQGPRSCWARHHGIYVPPGGINPKTARAILSLISRELRAGRTFDHSCNVIKMTPRLAVRRAVYLIALAKKHGGTKNAWAVRELVYDWLRATRLSARMPAVRT